MLHVACCNTTLQEGTPLDAIMIKHNGLVQPIDAQNVTSMVTTQEVVQVKRLTLKPNFVRYLLFPNCFHILINLFCLY